MGRQKDAGVTVCKPESTHKKEEGEKAHDGVMWVDLFVSHHPLPAFIIPPLSSALTTSLCFHHMMCTLLLTLLLLLVTFTTPPPIYEHTLRFPLIYFRHAVKKVVTMLMRLHTRAE